MPDIKAIKTQDGTRIEVGGEVDGHGVRRIEDNQMRVAVYLSKDYWLGVEETKDKYQVDDLDELPDKQKPLKREYMVGNLEYIEYEKGDHDE